jgi:hypothetical protein
MRTPAIAVFILGLMLLVGSPPESLAQTHSVLYFESEDLFPNPERGFYAHRQANSQFGPPLSVTDLRGLRANNVSLVLRIYYLKSFRNDPMSETQLNLIEQDFNVLREAGSKAILRFAYSSSSTEPDAPMSTIQEHLTQLAPLFEAHRDVIAVVQAGFIGAWGEWYYSSNNLDNTVSRRQLTERILEVLPGSRMVQVRTPNYKRNILGPPQPPALTEEQAHTQTPIARIGHHNDCFVASANDVGTYQNITVEKAYLEQETKYLAMGGETCGVSAYSGCENSLAELERFKWSYINQGYHPDVLAGWEAGGCMEEVRRRLGYRFSLLEGEFAAGAESGGSYSFDLDLTNNGWAAPYNARLVELILRHRSSGEDFVAVLPDDPRFWLAGDTIRLSAEIGIPAEMQEGIYDVFLNLPAPEPAIRRRAEFSIRLATFDAWQEDTGYNDLHTEVVVGPNTSGAMYDGPLWFRPIDEVTSNDERPQPGSGAHLSGPSPNPFTSETTFRLDLDRSQHVRADVHDMAGRHVAVLYDGFVSGGSGHFLHLSGRHLAAGMYMVRVSGEDFRLNSTAILVR